MFGSVFGMNSSMLGNTQNATQGLGGLANQYSSQYNTYKAQQTQAALWNQAMSQGMARQQHKYMINGRTMHFDEFLNELCPDKDDPMRTFLTLKYKGMEK